ncbi:hypothetical protein B484DRAFT_399764 [Ochromonadaceae sp. CCMP2298]|nr:hypothetical protein B484DRAFT_399764 [Ochromonadaceae sp. CCMP2298]|mmetsp:Transcript_30420/g.67282  ORF Transcript_30420/g.67282 Transcript_30420/m.67282 type:complete len:392 (+) Transcript_30420:66-1241(+)
MLSLRFQSARRLLHTGRAAWAGIPPVQRKVLIPLIKQLHPDLLAQHSEDVRKRNMACIQNLNDLWDTIEENVSAMTDLASSLDIRAPLNNRYDLSCFLKQKDIRSSQTSVLPDAGVLVEKLCVVRVPEGLCQRGSISQRAFVEGISSVLRQQGALFTAIGLENPWLGTPMGTDSSRTKPGQRGGYGGGQESEAAYRKSASFAQLEKHLFERWVTKSSASGGGSHSSLLFAAESRRGQKHLDRIQMRRLCSQDAKTLLQRGQVLVLPPLSPTQEVQAVQHLHSFLVDYGDVLNFSVERWSAVVVVLHLHAGMDKYGSAANTETDSEAEQAQAVAGREEEAAGKGGDELAMGGGYSIAAKSGFTVLKVPHNFKPRHLLDFCAKHLPASQISFM